MCVCANGPILTAILPNYATLANAIPETPNGTVNSLFEGVAKDCGNRGL